MSFYFWACLGCEVFLIVFAFCMFSLNEFELHCHQFVLTLLNSWITSEEEGKDMGLQVTQTPLEILCKVFKLWWVCFVGVFFFTFLFLQHRFKELHRAFINVLTSQNAQAIREFERTEWWNSSTSWLLFLTSIFMFLTLRSEEDYHLYHSLRFVLSRKENFFSKRWILMVFVC